MTEFMGDVREFMGRIEARLDSIDRKQSDDATWRKDHEAHDDLRHKEAMKAIGAIELAREREAGRVEGGDPTKPWARRESIAGMDNGEALRTLATVGTLIGGILYGLWAAYHGGAP